MRIRIRALVPVTALVLALSAAAEVDTTITPREETPVAAEAPGADARERGLTALQAGNHFAAAAAFREAAGQGDLEAMRHLGDLAFAGKGVAQSYDQAIGWYCQAALVADMDSVDRLEAIELTSWSARRDALGWEAACEQWLKPPPPPVQTQTRQPSPEVKVEIIVQPEREQHAPAGMWPAYVPWPWRWVNPRHNPRNALRPRPPVHAPGLYSK